MVEDQEGGVQVVHVKSEMPVRHPNGDVKWAVGYWSPEIKEEVELGNINLGVSSVQRIYRHEGGWDHQGSEYIFDEYSYSQTLILIHALIIRTDF